MKGISSKTFVKYALQNDAPDLVEALDSLRGSSAVEYVLEALLAKGNQHTLYSILELIRRIREKSNVT